MFFGSVCSFGQASWLTQGLEVDRFRASGAGFFMRPPPDCAVFDSSLDPVAASRERQFGVEFAGLVETKGKSKPSWPRASRIPAMR